MSIPVVYEDNWLCVVNKPSGLLTTPTPKKEKRTLTQILNDGLKNRGVGFRLHPCHRLDRDTSGLIIYAKGKSIQKKMMQLFRQKRVKKTYVAFVQGNPLKAKGEICNSIDGREAITKYRVIRSSQDFSMVEVEPLTGRKNQIRIHFKQIGHPILGEDRFAFRRDFKLKAKRLCLHAQGLEFVHPITKQRIQVKTELPEFEITRR